jgi:hypothetical protein
MKLEPPPALFLILFVVELDAAQGIPQVLPSRVPGGNRSFACALDIWSDMPITELSET